MVGPGDCCGGAILDLEPGCPVTANGDGLVTMVRHAQDNVSDFEPGFDWAEAAVTVRCLVEPPEDDPSREVIYRGVLSTPCGAVSIGDADDQVVIPAHPIETKIVVSVLAGPTDNSPDEVWLDLVPAR
jgi:hypothetical protein